MPSHFIAIAIGFLLDRLIGDPPNWPHPVRWIGSFISKMTLLLNKGRHRVWKGAVLFFATVGIVTVTAAIIVWLAYEIHTFVGIAIEAVLIAIGLAQKSLRDAALAVKRPLENGDFKEAREKLSWIVGRDTEKLDESEISRATIETVSENTADGVTSPLFWAFLLGAPGLWLYKAVNTLDSMVGYKDDRFAQFGKFSAKADDLLNYIPARITGLLILFHTANEGKLPFGQRVVGFGRDSRRHPSPNSGFPEAATAWQLGIRLGGKSTYRGVVSARPEIGPGIMPLTAKHIQSAVRQMHIASFVFWLWMTVIGVFIFANT
ncbi:adenosylcobinamide-phosphate synthase CbiB [Sporosarcina sp. 179-K 3D1 HS]